MKTDLVNDTEWDGEQMQAASQPAQQPAVADPARITADPKQLAKAPWPQKPAPNIEIPGEDEPLPTNLAEATKLVQSARALAHSIPEQRNTVELRDKAFARAARIAKHCSALQQTPAGPVIDANHHAMAAEYRKTFPNRRAETLARLEQALSIPVESIPLPSPESVPDLARRLVLKDEESCGYLRGGIRVCQNYFLSFLNNYSEIFPAERVEELQHQLSETTGDPDARRIIADEIDRLSGPSAQNLRAHALRQVRQAYEQVPAAVNQAVDAIYDLMGKLHLEVLKSEHSFYAGWELPREQTSVSKHFYNLLTRVAGMRMAYQVPALPHPEVAIEVFSWLGISL
ncbi:MAG TPA: hypothetical protein VFE51_22885 [Verrucomicrobiae bacterium]|nr:hypothetical protein [Verrucomicrobiae bacterium]